MTRPPWPGGYENPKEFDDKQVELSSSYDFEGAFMAEKHINESEDLRTTLAQLAGEEYCYVTTTGRISGRPHEIEIWFGINDGSLYLLSGGMDSSDWVKNMHANPAVTVRIGERRFSGTARFVLDELEETQARHMLAAKYQGWREGRKLSGWARTALAVAIDLTKKL